MVKKTVSDAEFIRLFELLGPLGLSQEIGIAIRNVHERRRRIEAQKAISILAPPKNATPHPVYPQRALINIQDGVAVVFSDAHFWPGRISTGFRALKWAVKEFKPVLLNNNGDAFDGPKVSRHPPLGWENPPTPAQELECVDDRLEELRAVTPKDCALVWCQGNHDARFDMRLADRVGEYKGVRGFKLSDHFPHWQFTTSLHINDQVVIKHRYKGGVHATHNNTVNAGKTVVTGHLHSLKVTPFDDYNGTRWGVDTGTLDDPYGPQFAYAEDNPLNHRSGFAILTFAGGRLLWPELVHVIGENQIEFRGQIINLPNE